MCPLDADRQEEVGVGMAFGGREDTPRSFADLRVDQLVQALHIEPQAAVGAVDLDASGQRMAAGDARRLETRP